MKLMLQTHSPYRERTPDGGKPHPSKSSASWSFSELGCSEPANICSAVSFVVPPFLRTVLGREMCAVGDGGRQRLAEDRWAQVGHLPPLMSPPGAVVPWGQRGAGSQGGSCALHWELWLLWWEESTESEQCWSCDSWEGRESPAAPAASSGYL